MYNVFAKASDFLKLPDSLHFKDYTVNFNPVENTKTAVEIEFPRRKELLETTIER